MTDKHTVTDTITAVMTERPLTVRAEDSVSEVFQLMEERGVAACPVTTEQGDLYGMVSRVDLLRALRPSRELRVLTPGQVAHLPVKDVMHCGIVTVEPEDFLLAAVDLFMDTRLHALPVVRRGPGRPRVVGIVTQGDVLRYLMRTAVTAGV